MTSDHGWAIQVPPPSRQKLTARIRDASERDLGAIAKIYAHHVRYGLASFEEVPPGIEELRARRAAVLGYLSQLAIQTLPLLRLESGLDREPFTFITNIPPPGYSRTTSSTPDANPEAEIGEKMAQGMSQKEARQVVEGRQT
jgi:hypothetical protein